MFTKADFAAALPAAFTAAAYPQPGLPADGAEILTALADKQDDCFTADAEGIWWCCGNEDAWFPYAGPATAAEAAAALADMYRRWQIQYDAASHSFTA